MATVFSNMTSKNKLTFLLLGLVSFFLLMYHFNWIHHETAEVRGQLLEMQSKDPEDIQFEVESRESAFWKNSTGVYRSGVFQNEAFEFHEVKSFFYEYDERHYLIVSIPLEDGVLAYAESIDNYLDAEAILIEIAFIVFFVALLVSFFISRLVADVIEKPLRKIIEKVQRIDFQHMSFDINIRGNKKDSIVQLTTTFDDLFKRLRVSAETMKQFNHDVSHELKTPLAIIISDLELAAKTKNLKMLEKTKKEAQSLSHIIDQMLFLVHEPEKIVFTKISVEDCIQILRQAGERYGKFYASQNIRWNMNVDKKFSGLKTNQYLLEDLLNNAVQNAYKHNKKMGDIVVALDEKSLVITNDSQEISSDDLQHIFEPFYKAKHSKSLEGYGIGLSVMKKIADLLHYQIFLKSEAGTVSCVIEWGDQ